MSNLVQCGCCRGQKKIIGLGNMSVDCFGCKGVGFVERLALKVEAEVTPNVVITEYSDEPSHEVFQSEIAKKLAKRVNVGRRKKVA